MVIARASPSIVGLSYSKIMRASSVLQSYLSSLYVNRIWAVITFQHFVGLSGVAFRRDPTSVNVIQFGSVNDSCLCIRRKGHFGGAKNLPKFQTPPLYGDRVGLMPKREGRSLRSH